MPSVALKPRPIPLQTREVNPLAEASRWAQEAWAKGADVGVVVPAGELVELIRRADRR